MLPFATPPDPSLLPASFADRSANMPHHCHAHTRAVVNGPYSAIVGGMMFTRRSELGVMMCACREPPDWGIHGDGRQVMPLTMVFSSGLTPCSSLRPSTTYGSRHAAIFRQVTWSVMPRLG